MTPRAAGDRQRWAVESMAVAAGDRVLEIGCGGGTATSLVAARLDSGRVLAIDRSATAVRAARERNAARIYAGTVEVRQADITSAELPEGEFDRVFAVNLSLFWLATPAGLVERVRRLLAPGGTLYVFAERPTRAAVAAIAGETARALRAGGFDPVTASVTRNRAAVVAAR
ncbi:class I SAM-dependent methyltransferase [Phytohabitans kaempferiae]|uniref:Class I SAM-dependent methyltransferase n=1 Tax=Phytohabitans kaempferiae TaxID=1620943 RepID=A0ABV6M9M4_9ACTN